MTKISVTRSASMKSSSKAVRKKRGQTITMLDYLQHAVFVDTKSRPQNAERKTLNEKGWSHQFFLHVPGLNMALQRFGVVKESNQCLLDYANDELEEELQCGEGLEPVLLYIFGLSRSLYN